MRALLLALLAAALPMAADAAEVTATSHIEQVTVFPSGAEVVRTAKVQLDRGEHTVVFRDLPAAALAGSIRVEGKASGKLEIGSVDSRRLSVPRGDPLASPEERKRLEDELETLRDDRARLDGEVEAAETQKSLLTNLAQLPGNRPEAPQSAAGLPREDWTQILGLIGTGTAEAHRALVTAQAKIRDANRKVAEAEKKLGEMAPPRDERTEVKVYLAAEAPVEAELAVRYQVAGASWSPFYDARLATGSKTVQPKLEITRRASVSQTTGENWDDVTLALSTSRPAAGTAAPELVAMSVDVAREEKPKLLPPPSPSMADEMERSRGTRAAPDVAAAPAPEPTREAIDAAIPEKPATVAIAPFQAMFAVPGKVSVPSTGEEKRVQLQEDTIEPTLSVRIVAKLDAKAYLYAKFTVPKGSPFLPGPVSLFRDATFVGNGALPVLSSGEDHELGFGVDDLVRVRYAVMSEKRGETGLISSFSTDERAFKVTVKNTHERAIDVTLYDQIPTSKNEVIKVDLLGRTPPARRDIDDKRGVLAWDMKLEADEERSLDFGYRVSWPSDKRIEYGN